MAEAEDPTPESGLDDLVSLGRYAECILESMTSGVVAVDTLSRITLVNREAAHIFERDPDELVGRLLIDLPNLGGLLKLVNQVRTSRHLYDRSSRQYEAEIETFGGRTVPLGISINALLDDDRSVLGYVMICKDLSERKQLEATVARAERLSSLGTMASGVAHNFNNILAAILGRVQLLLRYPERMDLRASLELMQKSALDGAAMVKRLQDFARVRVGGGDFQPLDPGELIKDAVDFARPRWETRAIEHKVQFRVQVEVGECGRVSGSASELREVLQNLIHNAIDAMPGGGDLTLAVRQQGTMVEFEVVDTGEGMTEEVRTRIFDPFFTTKGAEGLGLGLAESYGIVKRHAGTFQVESRPGAGTRFKVLLPVTEGDAVGDSTRAAPRAVPRTGRILIVDDEAEQAELLAEMLRPEGHAVEVCSRPQDALRRVSRKDLDLLISDLSMPGVTGWELAREARTHSKGMGIVLVTGLAAALHDEEATAAGVDRCLAKPIRLDELVEIVAMLVNRSRQEAGR